MIQYFINRGGRRLSASRRFPAIWMPSTEVRDLRALLRHRHQWVRMRTLVQNAVHAIILGSGVQRGHALWNRDGHGAGRAAHRHDAADDRRVVEELSLPDVVTQDHDGLRTLHFVRRLQRSAGARSLNQLAR
jgi:hypothetical protein